MKRVKLQLHLYLLICIFASQTDFLKEYHVMDASREKFASCMCIVFLIYKFSSYAAMLFILKL